MNKSKAETARSILRIIDDCEQRIKSIENIKSYNIHISGEENYIRVPVLPEIRAQIKEIAIDAYRKRIEEMENQLADL